AAQPHERAQARRELANVQQLARRERVEVADEDVKVFRPVSDRLQHQFKLATAAALRPVRVNRAQVYTVDAHAAREHYRHEAAAGPNQGMPLVALDGHAADEAYGVAFARGPRLHPRL